MDIAWDGITRAEGLDEDAMRVRHALADAARGADWPLVFELLAAHRELVNSTRLNGSSRYTPLHQAAHGDAPVEVIRRLVHLGAWRSLRNARGERAVDVAERCGHRRLIGALTPEYRRDVPLEDLRNIQLHFHIVIQGRAKALIREHALRLPELEPLLELASPHTWFPVPGMYGGFSYELKVSELPVTLVSESWSRVVGGSGQRHEITTVGSRLVEEGFV